MKSKQELKYYFDFLWAMTEKEIKARYKKTIFGFLWVILNPLLQMLIIGFIFSFFIKLPVDNYYLFLFSGLLPWQFFSLSLSKATTSFVYESSLLQKAQFPREAIPISIIISNYLHFSVSIFLLISYLVLTRSLLFPQVLYLIPACTLLFIFTIALSLLTATYQVRYRDINFFVQSLLMLWFYATPIIYNLSLIPVNMKVVYYINPLTYIFELFHASVVIQSLPNINLLIINTMIIILIILVGLFLYKKESRYFVDWL